METENKCTVVITGKFKEGGKETPEFKEYSERATAAMKANGGEVKSFLKVEKNLGDGETQHVVIVVEFPSKEKAVETYTSEEYISIVPLRQVGTSEVNILITE